MRGKGQRGIHMQDTCATRIHRHDACATRLIVGLVVLLVLVAGCASRPEGPSPDYGRYLAAMERVAEMEAGVDRTIFSLTVG